MRVGKQFRTTVHARFGGNTPLLFLSPPIEKIFCKKFQTYVLYSAHLWSAPLSSMDDFIPEVDENVPLPASALEAMPPLSAMEEVEMRGRTLRVS